MVTGVFFLSVWKEIVMCLLIKIILCKSHKGEDCNTGIIQYNIQCLDVLGILKRIA